jgi:hypothetical protein
MCPPLVILDANILYSETLTDVFMVLAEAGLLAVCWSDRLQQEWLHTLRRNRPDLGPAWIAGRSHQLDSATGWQKLLIDEAIVKTLTLPDADDRHVLAAAIQSAASIIATANLRDFPRRTLENYGVRALPADAVLCQLMATAADRVVAAVLQDYRRLVAPDMHIEAYLEKLRRAGLARLVKALRPHLTR